MKALTYTGLAAAVLALLAYTVGLGIFAVASTPGPLDSQPRDEAAARAAVRALGIEREYPFAHGFVATPHGRMHYVESGQGAPVLCLHGNPTWSYLYREFLRGLAPVARVVAPDLIGFGLSEKLAEVDSYSVEGHIDDVSALVETLDLRDLTLVMQDWGGPIGLGVAARHPDRISALVVMNTIGFVPQGHVGPPEPALSLIRAPMLGEQLVQGLGLFNRLAVPAGIGRPERRDPTALRAYRDVQGSWSERAGTLFFPRAIPNGPDHPSIPVLEETGRYLDDYSGPLLLIWGMRDPAFGPPILAQWRERFPDAPVLELEDASHFLQEDRPEQIVPRIKSFLAGSELAVREVGVHQHQ